jgi:two-component system, chemotaxis family, chemotaxis protein CheY
MDKKNKILIADDSSFMRKILKDILQTEGFIDFIECGNGKECLEKYDSEKPDLVLLDLIMPEVDGLEVLKKIGKDAKVLVISAVGQEKILEEARNFGAKGCIIKPFDNKQVVLEVNRIL